MRRTVLLPALILILAGLPGCSGDPEPDLAETERVRPGLPLPELLEGLTANALDRDRLAVLGRLNRPRRVERTPQPNRHDPTQTDTVRTLHYDGLDVEVYEVSASGKELASKLEVTSSAYETADGLRVGSTHEEVERALGEPTEVDDGALVYQSDDITPTTLRFDMEGSRVEAMTWFFYLD